MTDRFTREQWDATAERKNKLFHMLDAIESVSTDAAIRAELSEHQAATLDAALSLAYALEDSWADKLKNMELSRIEAERYANEMRSYGLAD